MRVNPWLHLDTCCCCDLEEGMMPLVTLCTAHSGSLRHWLCWVTYNPPTLQPLCRPDLLTAALVFPNNNVKLMRLSPQLLQISYCGCTPQLHPGCCCHSTGGTGRILMTSVAGDATAERLSQQHCMSTDQVMVCCSSPPGLEHYWPLICRWKGTVSTG